MCWITHNEPIIKVAKNDVKVLKIVHVQGLMILPYFFPYKRYGNIDNEEFSIDGDGLFSSDEGLDIDYNSYRYWSCRKAIHSYLPEMITFEIGISQNVMIHTIDNEHLEDYYGDNLFMDCIIPKGTKYAINERGEVVSEKIKVTGFRKIK